MSPPPPTVRVAFGYAAAGAAVALGGYFAWQMLRYSPCCGAVAFGVMLAGLVLLPAIRAIARREEFIERRRRGQCVHCGYDLRATPSPVGPLLATCPECGAARIPDGGIRRAKPRRTNQ